MQNREGGQRWTRGSRSSGLPGDAVRRGSVDLPRREQVHGHRSVESAAPGEAQPAASLRHGPGQSDTELEDGGGGQQRGCFCRPGRLFGVGGGTWAAPLRVTRRTGSFVRPAWEVGNRGGNGASAELPLKTTPLGRCESWRGERGREGEPSPHRRTEGGGARKTQAQGRGTGS